MLLILCCPLVYSVVEFFLFLSILLLSLLQVSTCTTCAGEGEVISDYCRKCGGEGRIRVKKNIKVKIPAGVNNGSTLRVRGEGDVGPRGYAS